MATTVKEKKDRQIAQHYSAKGHRSAELKKGIEDFIPASGTIVLKQYDPETVTAGGIHIPEAYATEQLCGEVVAIPEEQCEYALGDIVLFRCGGCPVVLNDTSYIVVQFRGAIDDEILGRFKKESV